MREIRWTERSEDHIARHGVLPAERSSDARGQSEIGAPRWVMEVHSVNEQTWDELREHYETTELTGDIDAAVWEDEVEPDPMVVTSVRLPKSLLDWLREQAVRQQIKPTALIRRWIEEQRDAHADATDDGSTTLAQLSDRVSRLETLAVRAAAGSRNVQDQSTTESLAALQRSVDAAREKSGSVPSDQVHRGA